MKQRGKLYLIPIPIAEDAIDTIAKDTLAKLPQLRFFIVERTRTARRFLRAYDGQFDIDSCTFAEVNKYSNISDILPILVQLEDGQDVGLMSEAGCPGVADPGHVAVRWAHEHGISVVPLVGPSSILLALMASGMNGQNFAFHGYLPNKKPQLVQKIKQLEQAAVQQGQTQIFMDTPYRNEFLVNTCLEVLHPDILLCVAANITSENEFIRTSPVKEWQGFKFDFLHKIPAIILIGSKTL